MFLKCSKAADNVTVFQHFLLRSTRLSRRGETPARGAALTPASRLCLHHEARHLSPPNPGKKEQLPSSASAAPGEPCKEQAAVVQGTLGKGRVKEGPIHPLASKRHCQVQFRGWVVQKQKMGTLLEIRKGKKGQWHSKRLPSSWF